MADQDRTYRQPRMWIQPQVLWRRVLQSWPLLVWALAIGIILWLQDETSQYGTIAGVVYTEEQNVAPIETARLLSLEVPIGGSVTAGQVVAVMDSSILDAEYAAAEALAAEDDETLTRYQDSILRLSRQVEADLEKAQADYLSEKIQSMQTSAELAELRTELARREALLAKQLIREEDVTALKPQIAALEKAEESYPELLAIREQRIQTARKDVEETRRWLRLEPGQLISDAIQQKRVVRSAVLASGLEALAQRRSAYLLRAAQEGEIARVFHQPGEVVPGGEPVIRIVRRSSPFVVGFLRETQIAALHEGQRVSVWRHGNGARRYDAVVESVSPDIEWLPGVVSPIPNQVLRGRRVMIRIPTAHTLVPGETVQIRTGRESILSHLRNALLHLFRRGDVVQGG
jgi:multidrug resistance efflux pump